MITASMSLFGFDLLGPVKAMGMPAKPEAQNQNCVGAGAAGPEDWELESVRSDGARTQRDESFYWLRHPIY